MRRLAAVTLLVLAACGQADEARPTERAVPLSARPAGADVPTHREVAPIRPQLGPSGKLETIAMDRNGRLLAGVSSIPAGLPATPVNPQVPTRGPAGRPGSQPAADDAHLRRHAIQVLSSAGELLQDWTLPEGLQARMLHATETGLVYVGGDHALATLNESGAVLRQVSFAALLDGRYADAHASGLTANADHVYLALGRGRSLQATEDVVRLKSDLSDPRVVAENQFGCCSHIDLECRSGELLIAENSRHRVNRLTFDGQLIERWGKRDRVGLEGFAACCNPVNFDLGPEGVLYTAESGIGRVKKYSPDGRYLGLVGYVDTTEFDRGSFLASISCYIPIEVAADGRRIYVMDVRQHLIRVLEALE